MRIVGLDIATKTGWCVLVDGECVSWGTLNLTPKKGEREGLRYWRLAMLLPEVIEGADLVVIERTYSKGAKTAQVLKGLAAVALVACEINDIPYEFVDASHLKRWATGKGNAKKPEMIAAALAAIGVTEGMTDDEADAYHLAAYGQAHQ